MTGIRLPSFLKNRPDARAFSANVGWLLADKLTRFFVAIFVSAWVARYLGPERYGVLAYAVAFISLFQAVSLLGLDNLVVRDIAADPSRAHRILGTALRLRLIAATVAYFALGAWITQFQREDTTVTVVVLLVGLAIFFQVFDVIDLWFQSCIQSRRTVVAKTLSYLVTAVIKVVLIQIGANLSAFAAAHAVETGLAAAALSLAYADYRTKQRWQWDGALARALLTQSWPLLLSGLSILLYMRVSVVFLRESAGSAEVGLYSVAATLSEMWYFVPMALGSSIAPIVSRQRAAGGDGHRGILLKAFAAMWMLSLTVVALNVLGARYVVALLYGQQYAASAPILAIHALTFIPVCLGVMQSVWLINEGRSKLALYQAMGGAITALSLNLILTPRFGAYGAAISTVTSQFVQAFLVNAVLAPDLFRLQCRSIRVLKALRT